jgi:protein involved in polysaccharide export with SLBB domain
MKKVISNTIVVLLLLFPLVANSAPQGAERQKAGPVSAPPAKKTDEERKSQGTGVSASLAGSPSQQSLRPGALSKGEVSETTADQRTPTDIYRVGVGDVLDVRLLNSATSRSTLFTVIAGGLIDLPIAGGPISVSGLTPEEIQGRIAAELKRRAVEDSAQVVVGVRQYGSHTVVLTGLVTIPGTKILRREAVPLYVIFAETQLRNDAGKVVIMRGGSPGPILDLSDSSTLNSTVVAGDVITVSGRTQEFYYIGGRINYPGQKAFQPSITLLQAILASGGLAKQGDNVVEISREGGDGKLITTKFNVKQIKQGKTEDPRLEPGDRIEVLR